MGDEYADREQKESCRAHRQLVIHDENTSVELAKISERFKGIYWLAALMLVTALGSIGAVLSVSYQFGSLAQAVSYNTEQNRRTLGYIERHVEREQNNKYNNRP